MLIKDLRKIIINENPCISGLAWFDYHSRGHVNTTTFFKSIRKTKKDKWPFSPHGYLRWIFYKCLDWDEVVGPRLSGHFHITSYFQYAEFIRDNFNVTHLYDLPVSQLCDALSRALEDEE